MAKFVIQPHVRLQEWVADEAGYFTEEGLDYEIEQLGYAGATLTTSSVHAADDVPLDARSGAFEHMAEGRSCDVSGACHWAVNAAASATGGKMYGKAYGLTPGAIFVSADSPYERPEDLAGVPVAVGYHSGSHYSAIQSLEPFLDRSQIELSYAGLPYDRVRLLIRGDIPAANVFGAQLYIMEQLGFRKLVDTTFIIGFLIREDADREDVERFFRALRRAQGDIDLEPERYKHFWSKEMPDDIAEMVDVRRFGPGERMVFEPYTREMYEATHRWMKTWDLLDIEVSAEEGYRKAVLV
jgi:NitT/TauT family transport system substrate-binding protein